MRDLPGVEQFVHWGILLQVEEERSVNKEVAEPHALPSPTSMMPSLSAPRLCTGFSPQTLLFASGVLLLPLPGPLYALRPCRNR